MVEGNSIGECLVRNEGIRGVVWCWSVLGVGWGEEVAVWRGLWQMELPQAGGGGA